MAPLQRVERLASLRTSTSRLRITTALGKSNRRLNVRPPLAVQLVSLGLRLPSAASPLAVAARERLVSSSTD